MGRKKKLGPIPDSPTHELVSMYVRAFAGNERFIRGDEAIRDLVSLFPQNITFSAVLAKVCVINDLYATGIAATFEMAMHIIALNVDQAFSLAETEIVDRIAHLRIGDKTRHNYSFATKYSAWHRPEHYPMFDSFVRKMLIAYRDKNKFTTFEDEDLRRYPQFKNIYIAFQSYYGLTRYSFRELDHFLWEYGKVLFPKQY